MGAGLSQHGTISNASRLIDGAGPTEENLGRFTFDGNSLTIYFDPYQVGSYAWGSREVGIWSSELKGFKANL